MSFSNVVRLNELSDYIAPSQVCILPLQNTAASSPISDDPKDADLSSGLVHMHRKSATGIGAQEIKESRARITLADCLACSGCVTTAEEILITQQSTQEVDTVLSQFKQDILLRTELEGTSPERNRFSHRITVVSISPQTVASLCAFYQDVQPCDTFSKLYYFLTRIIGIDFVCSTDFAQKIGRLLTMIEYTQRLRSNSPNQSALPLLVSSCPGFVCYIEKKHPELLPFLSRIMSPQGITGKLLEAYFKTESRTGGSHPSYYHVSLQPCFDRKLEAARPELSESTHCVIATSEILDWIQQKDIDWHNLPVSAIFDHDNPLIEKVEEGGGKHIRGSLLAFSFDLPMDFRQYFPRSNDSDATRHWLPPPPIPSLPSTTDPNESLDNSLNIKMEGSGAYHKDALFLQVFKKNSDISLNDSKMRYRTRRNVHHAEAYLDSSPDLFTTVMYGFQHIQNVTRTIRNEQRRVSSTSRSRDVLPDVMRRYSSFIEIMACPGGCVHGGAQAPQESLSSGNISQIADVTTSQTVEQLYCIWEKQNETLDQSCDAVSLYDVLLRGEVLSRRVTNRKDKSSTEFLTGDELRSFCSYFSTNLTSRAMAQETDGVTEKQRLDKMPPGAHTLSW